MGSTKIIKPIFIVGAGRSGTSVFYNHLAIHPDLCWFSNYSDKYPNQSKLAYLHRILELPVFGAYAKKNILQNKRFALRPAEGGNIYHKYSGFTPAKKLSETDVDKSQEGKFLKAINNHLIATNKKRFLSKQTANTQRIRVINDLFKDAYFIHVIRDGRAVANSLYNVGFWKEIDIWWDQNGLSKDRDKIEICALHWEKNINEITENKHILMDRYHEVRYENLCSNFKKEMGKVLDFCELKFDNEFMKLMPEQLPNRNLKWKEKLTENQKEILLSTLKESLLKYDYQ